MSYPFAVRIFFIPITSFNILTFFLLSLYYFILVSMHKCVGKHSCMSTFPIAILNGTCFICKGEIVFLFSKALPMKNLTIIIIVLILLTSTLKAFLLHIMSK